MQRYDKIPNRQNFSEKKSRENENFFFHDKKRQEKKTMYIILYIRAWTRLGIFLTTNCTRSAMPLSPSGATERISRILFFILAFRKAEPILHSSLAMRLFETTERITRSFSLNNGLPGFYQGHASAALNAGTLTKVKCWAKCLVNGRKYVPLQRFRGNRGVAQLV